MEKIKRWHIGLIVLVVALTIYNILPTLIYYSKPLSKPIQEKQAMQIAGHIVDRVNSLQEDSIDWVTSYSKNLGIKPKSIELAPGNPKLIEVTFSKPKEAAIFKRFLPKAGALIPFVPAQLSLAQDTQDQPNRVLIERKIGFAAKDSEVSQLFKFAPQTKGGEPSPRYHELVLNRFNALAMGLGGSTSNAAFIESIKETPSLRNLEPSLLEVAQSIVSYENLFSDRAKVTQRYFQSFSQFAPKLENTAEVIAGAFNKLEAQIERQLKDLEAQSDRFKLLERDLETLKSAAIIVKRNAHLFNGGATPFTLPSLEQDLAQYAPVQTLELGQRNPFIESMTLDWEKGRIDFSFHPDVTALLSEPGQTSLQKHQQEKINSSIINEMARVSQKVGESIKPVNGSYQIALNEVMDSQSLLVLNLADVAKQEATTVFNKLQSTWNPQSPDLEQEVFPVWNYQEYQKLDPKQSKFGLLVYAPVQDTKQPIRGFRNNSLYVVAKGLNSIFQKYQSRPDSPEARQFLDEFQNLQNLLLQQGFQLSYLAEGSAFPKAFKKDLIFEKPDYYADLLAATRENFTVHGDQKYATLELTDLEERILTENKIDTQVHNELIKWKDDYQAAQVDLQDPTAKFVIPPPTRNIYWDNFKLSFKEYFRGDSRKILKWGLDIKGGRSILIGLKDQNNRPVTNKADLSEGANELTQRVNKMGLSEVDIRVEGQNIALDFPSSKGLSAQELIKGSTMLFHVVNETYSSSASPYFEATQKFLQDVWNEAVITNRKDIEGIHAIAWKHLGGSEDSDQVYPRSEYAKTLYQSGLRLARPGHELSSSKLNETLSEVVPYTGSDYTDWKGQTTPLVMVFHNYALEGSQIDNIRTGYDSKDGNTLSFNVKGSYTNKLGDKLNPRESLYSWTSHFAKDRVMGTPKEKFTPGRGWRLAIVLNGRIINDPQLNHAIRDNVQVTGGFTQHEVNRLSADLKAGSLSFKPQILSETNVSADLGQKERAQGILATGIALLLVIIVMVAYYRFSGIVASVAVLFNLLIIWATLQNLQATLSLSGIAGIILTLGMAVDANVLVFERIREELKTTQRLATAIYTGYKQAFSAIFDSNITTVIAALILLNFDTGPIKGLAITLTIGITSSMFTALFMTRVFFTKWVEHTKSKTLHMANWFHVKSVNFLKNARWVSGSFALIILVGSTLLVVQHKSILGMDFTGGYSLNIQVEDSPLGHARARIRQALIQAGAKSTDVQIRELGDPNSLRIQLSAAMEEKARPFYEMARELEIANPQFSWQKNPRIAWVVSALNARGIELTPQSLELLQKNWSEMSGQLSKTTRNNALLGLSLAMFFILVYISFRFEIKFALSAILCILHDVLITLALLAILHLFEVPIQINMQVIAALMTIIGYSLNDTIIVFDRIREEKRLMKKSSFAQIINHSLSITLNRTLMTSLTTFIVLLALLVLGGAKIFDFSLMMSLGVVVGTLSSLFVAPLLLQYFHGREVKESSPTKPLQNGSAI